MANWWDGDHRNNDGGDDVNNPTLTRVEFYQFCEETQKFPENNQQFREETQQELCGIQDSFVALLARNPNHNDEKRRDNQARGPPHHGPTRNR